jgi:fucose permease
MLRALAPRTRRLYFLLLVAIAGYGLTMTVFGAVLPRLIRQFRWSYTASGAVLAASAAGFFLTTLASGYLLRRVTTRALIVGGALAAAAGLAAFARVASPLANMAASLAVGVGQGLLEVGIELEVIHMESGRSRLMNLIHAAFAVGAIGGPVLASAFLAGGPAGGGGAGSGWRLLFPASAAGLALIGALVAAWRFPRDVRGDRGILAGPHPGGPAATGPAPAGVASGGGAGALVRREPLLVLLAALLFCYVGSELGCTNWIAEHFVQDLGAPIPRAAFSTSLLWLGLLAGRLAISASWHGQRHERLLLALAVLSALALPLALLAGSQPLALALVFLTGLGFSGMYPLAISLTGQYFGTGMALGVVTTGAGLGSFSFPFLMSAAAEALGLRAALFAFAADNVVLVILSALILRACGRRHARAVAARSS